MILFKPEHVEPILSGRKTQTRRLGKKRWNVGTIHQARQTMFGEPFALLRVTAVRQEPLGDLTDGDAVREGYGTRLEYLWAFWLINRLADDPRELRRDVWVVDFELAGIGRDAGVIRAESPT